MPTTWLLIAILLMLALHLLVPGAYLLPPLWSLLGLIPLALGVVVNLLADRAFHQRHTTVKPFEQSAALVTDGVFRLTRNPMYLGFGLILIGIAVLLRSLTPFLVVFAFIVRMDRFYVGLEEQMLAEKFGAVWQAYKARARRWL